MAGVERLEGWKVKKLKKRVRRVTARVGKGFIKLGMGGRFWGAWRIPHSPLATLSLFSSQSIYDPEG
jgi:hypothetical protein